ncbi:Clp protease ClpP [Azoarcus sp. PA01]|nr:Clp protease ClpP [Azoarcus sp. PA01]
MPKSWFTVAAATAEAPAEVAIRGYIGEWGVNDRDFIAQVEALGDVKELTVRINSRGGEVDHALAIFNFLRAHAARVTVRVDGVAMSSGSIIAMAGDEIIMPANTVMMIHNPWNYAAGTAKDLRKAADDLEAFEAALLETYVARTGKSADEIRALLDEDTYMTAAEALEHGFCDTVEAIGKKSAAAHAFACALGIPAAVLAKIQQIESTADEGGDPASGDPAAAAGNPDPAHVTLATQINTIAVAHGLGDHVAAWLLDDQIATADQARAAIEQAREIRDLCAFAKQPALAAGLIRSRKTLAESRQALCDALAEADEATHTSNHLPAHPGNAAAPGGAAVWNKIFPPRQTKE